MILLKYLKKYISGATLFVLVCNCEQLWHSKLRCILRFTNPEGTPKARRTSPLVEMVYGARHQAYRKIINEEEQTSKVFGSFIRMDKFLNKSY